MIWWRGLGAVALIGLAACGPKPAPAKPKVDTRSLAAELDSEMAAVAEIIHRDRADCRALATELRAVFVRMERSIARARELQQDPALAKQLTSDMKAYDKVAGPRSAQIDADLTQDSPCVRDPAVREVLMSMPTL